ncbi:hypothetical protein CANINC_003498 [Pichia inconspicua]|uniref:Kinesin motor domain-containing protein n=1 Tax=Pichia inconspicua TaxID=52247 RepID=A0A4T0WYP6_9ASCO|nr:hypothetical protein CANINC_003498 [[Candida] inconspicua]
MHTPTRTPYSRLPSNGSTSILSTNLRNSSFNNQRNISAKDHYNSPDVPNRSQDYNSTSNSRNISRNNSSTFFQQPPQIMYSPRGVSLSRSTSRSSSRLSLSSVASTSAGSVSRGSTLFLDRNTFSENTEGSRIIVSVRPRPLGPHEDAFSLWSIDHDTASISHPELGTFQYDHVFSTFDDNRKVFEVCAAPIIEKCLNGFNSTIFAYGMTGSGKTHSMQGVLRNSIEMLFDNMSHNSKNSMMSDRIDVDNKGWMDEDVFQDETLIVEERRRVKYIKCSILEIYNEKLKDLISGDGSGNGRELRIVDDKRFGNRVHGLSEVEVTSPDQLLTLIDQGESLRSTDSTDYNYTSSRSHFLVMLKVFLVDKGNSERIVLLNFCDLAGSERATSHIDRRVEGSYINKSLLALGTVITKLSENTNAGSSMHIPYRDSKLTRLLQPSLSGGSFVSVLCTIHVGSNVIGETANTLRFGSRAKNVVLNVKRNNEELDLEKVIQENELLKIELDELRYLLDLKKDQDLVGRQTNSKMAISANVSDDIHLEIITENNILNEQVEHMKRMQLEESSMRAQETNEDILALHNLLHSLILDSVTRKKSEEILGRLNNDIGKYKIHLEETESYIVHLENRLRISEIESAKKSGVGETQIPTPDTPDWIFPTINQVSKATILQSDSEEILLDLQEEISELKRSLARKDAMIRALQKAVHGQ